MADDDPRNAHTECYREANHGRSVRDIRAYPPPLGFRLTPEESRAWRERLVRAEVDGAVAP